MFFQAFFFFFKEEQHVVDDAKASRGRSPSHPVPLTSPEAAALRNLTVPSHPFHTHTQGRLRGTRCPRVCRGGGHRRCHTVFSLHCVMCIFYFSKKIASWVMLSDADAAEPPRFLPFPVLAALTTVSIDHSGSLSAWPGPAWHRPALRQISDGASLPPSHPGLTPSQTL